MIDHTISKNIEKIILCGNGSSIPGLADYLAVGLKVPVELANVWTNIMSFEEEIPIIPQDSLYITLAPLG